MRQWEAEVVPQVVTETSHPGGVRCTGCGRVIETGEAFRLRDAKTGKLSTGPCIEDRVDAVFCEAC